MCFKPRKIPRHLILEQPPKPGWLQRHWVGCVLTCTLVMLGLILSDVARAEMPASHSGELHFASGHAATHLESEADVDITGLIARIRLTQQFRNDSDQWQEATYTFPLNETSAVNRMEMHIGEKRIVATIREKQEARKIYQAAVKAGKRAALTEQQRPNLFTQKVANLAPGETVAIKLEITQPVDYRAGRFSWRLPTTLTPRYIPGQPLMGVSASLPESETPAEPTLPDAMTTDYFGWARPTTQVPDADKITPPQRHSAHSPGLINPITLRVRLQAGLPLSNIAASYHEIDLHKQGEYHHITTREPQVAMDRDFELHWTPVVGAAPKAAFFTEMVEGENYGYLMLLPGQSPHTSNLPRDVTFIIDTSGSMSGPSIEQAKSSLQLALARLQPSDRFNVIEFNSVYSQVFPASVPASSQNLARAHDFVRNLQASGGTEMKPALEAALNQPASELWLQQLVFITDGSVGNEQELLSLIHHKLGATRLFTVGIGSAPNGFFMRKAAQFGRGDFVQIGDVNEVNQKMKQLFDKLESAALTQVKIDWPQAVEVEQWPARLPDLYAHQPLLVAARLRGPFVGQTIAVSGRSQAGDWRTTLTLTPNQPGAASKGVATLWARAKIDALLDQLVTGKSREEVRNEVLPIALTHQLLSPYTSFVAVEETPVRPMDQALSKTAVANTLPAGTPTLAYPRTATPAPLWLIAGCLSLLMAGLLRRRRHA
ncbi:marine proteobacterial sortase target protein [Simiduia agarivorans]|uniref:Inter-alpha-trypsin inhibitor domain-containing protein n=1 Tax=Simiduia agarivorans (strain DSM 21679 / JCM 13881 / BCRC 17597 / SA1) TaxID=1117647 RepID=K4KPG8_SIMAS|nr:marine proteobacterial sortase target protein [Simiduia agarivorans]AFV00932.1 inter-alpha-trypsin inhibitor domain-containing protein [Simiduia agarivorans SA1 = DSM 21679]